MLNQPNLQIQNLKTVPMPQTKPYSQQQQIIQHTTHSTTSTVTNSNPQRHLHQPQQQQHVQQINLAASTIHHQTQQHHPQQQSTPTPHMIQVSEEFLEQTANNHHNTGNMMISTTGEVINQQQIFKIVSTDGKTGNMIIDATNQNANSTTATSKVLLSNLTVLSKQQTTAQGQIIANNHQQSQSTGQTINFVNAKNLYTTSTAGGGNIAVGGKQQKFAVATTNVGNYKSSAIKQTSSSNTHQYIQQPNSIGQQKISMAVGSRNMQMLTTTRTQNATNSNSTSNVANNNSVAVISNNVGSAQTMVLQQPQKFIANTTACSKLTTAAVGSAGGNIIKKSTTSGTLRMNNSHNTGVTTKLINNLQTTQGVKTFITQTPCVQQQTQQNMNQLTVQHHTIKSGSKSKFVKQYNNAILNSAGAVAIATLPHQQSNSQTAMQIQQQQQQLQPQATYISHHKIGGGATKINKINSKYAQSANMAAQLPPGTHLQQKTINQTQQQQQFQTSGNNSNIKFVNAQGTIVQQQQLQQQQQQQQPLTPQKLNNKHHHHHQQQQYQNLQNFDTVDGNHIFNQTNSSQAIAGVTTSITSGTTTLPSVKTTGSSLLTDDIMMVNGTQMTDELSARILQSMSQKSFSNQRYQQQQQHVFQTKSSTITTTVTTPINSNNISSSNSNNNNNNMLPPPSCTTQNTIMQTNNNSNILLSPREYTLYPTTASASTAAIVTANQQAQQHSSPIHYNNSATPTATATSSNITAGSLSSNNFITVSNNSNNMTTITSHASGTLAANVVMCTNNTNSNSVNPVRQPQSAPSSRSQSMERKLHESSISRKSTEYYKVSNHHNSLRGSSHHNNLASTTAAAAQTGGSLATTAGNISASVSNLIGGVVSTSTPQAAPSSLSMSRPPSLPPAALIMEPQAQVIHLQATKTLPGANNSSNDDDDDDIIGEEIRPAPVDTEDFRLRILHAVLFDHTYVNPMPLVLPTSFTVQLPSATSSTALTLATPSGITTVAGPGQQWSLGGIAAISASGSGGMAQKNYTLYGTQLSRLHQDDDSFSALSNSSRLIVGDIDPGEETETAPEAELEDDSITRCICDLTHDDGYMICCDKCCAWQHVDCMGIDRQNIPDEYLCELCQPRIVDKARARSLQLMKRKEQQQQLLLTAQGQTANVGNMGTASSTSSAHMGGVGNLPNDIFAAQQRSATASGAGFNFTGDMTTDPASLRLLPVGGSNLKKNKMLKRVKDGVSGKRSKKAEKLAAATAGLSASSKSVRKETKKNTKRKKAGTHDSGISTVGMTAAEKHAANLRQWIENYELAVTNHYSPELRARLHAISKQPSLLQSILNTENPILKEYSNGSLENRATTVPHAGGKILISNLDIAPNSPICELRGKYMLTTQYKTQNTSMNMNSPPPNNYHLASYKAHKTPGPFIFFYKLSGTEVTTSSQLVPQTTTTTTLNPDGTYTTTTTTLPAQQSPPTFLKGPEICVDTRTYGNEARFVRRSCRPNAEIQHLFEKGTIHLFIVALTDIRASTEITIRHEPHDLLAVENKKSFSVIIQPTSTPCACGLIKDCIFGPPIPQLPPMSKSNMGRKSLSHSGGGSGSAGSITAKQRKANQQHLNRNRSISSSASGDSNMGLTATANTVALSLNSPNNVSKIATANKIVNNNTLMPLNASCNSNLSNASSTSSTLTSMMHDSGVCTSSSSPSVSIPSPTQHMHSPIQQQHQVHQQQLQQQFSQNTQVKSTVQLLPQQQQQQLMQSLPTPLVLTSPNMQIVQQKNQSQSALQQPGAITLQQPQLVAQAETSLNSNDDIVNVTNEQKMPQTSMCVPSQTATEQLTHAHPQKHPTHQQLLPEQQQQQQHQKQTQPSQHTASVLTLSADLLETDSTKAAIPPEVGSQSVNTSHSSNESLPVLSPACDNFETQLQTTQILKQFDATAEHLHNATHQHSKTVDNTIVSSSETSISSSLQSPQQQSQQQQQQQKSPHKNSNSPQNSSHPCRKTPAKYGRTTSLSEDNEQHHHIEDNSVTSTSTSYSTPKEKPKLSREDRKMEAILRAIEKMERNQQRKQEQKQAKRQNAGSQNTTPTSPNKSFESGENSGSTKRPNSHTGTAGRSRKKRKTGAKGLQGSGNNNQRKRRQSRMNSQESVDECNQNDHDAITSESDSCTVVHSPPIQTNASLSQPHFSTPTSSNVARVITTTARLSTDTTNNVDQAAGLLMAFANPNISPDVNSSSRIMAQHLQQSPHRSSSQYMSSSEGAASPPPTPPSQVSSACLLIEAAVGPLESNLSSNDAEIHNTEFKYPLQAKTKKHLMNNWLHQTDDTSPVSNVSPLPEQASQSLQMPASSVARTSPSGVSIASGGLDSLLQAAMSDLKQSQSDTEQPQNLSIAAQKVEEFIQQTEASACGTPTQSQTKHSFGYENHQQQQQQQQQHLPQRSYLTLPTPTVDLTLKTPLTIGPSPEVGSNNRNFHLPLQVSTCSNNSSVKKRWLRQAISEETHEDFQHTFSMTPSPTTGVVSNAPLPSVTCSPATNYVPNGFNTPLKKRRLLLSDRDEVEENLSQSCGDLCASSATSPPPVLVSQQHQQIQMQFNTVHQNKPAQQEFENEENTQAYASRDMHEDVDVDVEKSGINETKVHQPQSTKHPLQLQHKLYSKTIMGQEQNFGVTSSKSLEDQIRSVVIKHENNVPCSSVKQESLEASAEQIERANLTEFNDQDDDVDILKSPSPGREMIKAEDNLVKIEPEDTSGMMDDVKIDVEREESMAADDDVVIQHKEKKEVPTPKIYKENDQNNPQSLSEDVEIKKEFKVKNAKQETVEEKPNLELNMDVLKSKEENTKILEIKIENESHIEIHEPKPKKLKFEKSGAVEKELISVKEALAKEESFASDEICTKMKLNQKQQIVHSAKESEPETATKEKHQISSVTTEEMPSSPLTLQSVKTSSAATDAKFTDVEAATPPPSLTSAIVGGTAVPIRNHKSLSDDDIQARLHSFHKENILFLQSRNKKSKSVTNCLANNNELHKNRTSSSSANHQHHHSHHHHHEGKEKADKSGIKFRKTSSATTGCTSKKKLHKRERTSSSSSNSHKNSTNPQIPFSSSLLDKNVVNSNSVVSGSSKKSKSLKKSSSGSSTSSNTSLSSFSSSALEIPHNYPSITSTTGLNSEKERTVDKDKHHRPRTTSTPNSNNNAISSHLSYSTGKKRQLNFELELTKDMHLLNSVITGAGKNKRETSRPLPDEQGHVAAKKSRKDSQREEHKNKLVKTEKHDKKISNSNVGSISTKQSAGINISSNCQPVITPVTNNITTPTFMPTEEPKHIPTIVTQPTQHPPTPTPILRDHPTLPHFNNVVAISTSVQSQPLPTVVVPQNIPNRLNSPSYIASVHNNNNAQLQQPPLPPTPPQAGGMTSPLTTPNVNATSHLPFYNTIYGKLLDNSTPPTSLTTPLTPSNATTSPPSITSAAVPTGSGVLSEYMDTKLKSYNTLGGYVSHTALFGLNNATVKDPPASPALVSSSAITVVPATAHVRDTSSTEISSALPPPSTVSSCLMTSSGLGNITPLKIHTKTASHDPRLNPQLTAPEPPPQPKRKLSINEYRKRMQQSSSNDSNSGSGNLNTTPSTPPMSLETTLPSSRLGLGPIMPLTNKCTLNSPDRLTQSVDSQIQKEIMSTTPAASSTSSLDSLNSSNSSTSLNDTLLKSSSFVEEDSTKGQFNAAPTLLEKQQESLCARLKSLKEKQSLGTSFSVGSGNRSRFSSFSESVASVEFGLRKEDDDMDIIRNRNLSISSSIGVGDLLDNCLEEISSTSTSMTSSREPSPERSYTTAHHKILTGSATTTMTNNIATNHSNNGQTTRHHHHQHQHHHQKHNLNCDNSETSGVERKKSVDIV